MSKIVVSLKTARKQKARVAKRKAGDANAIKHGLSKAEKVEMQNEGNKLHRHLDSHFRERD